MEWGRLSKVILGEELAPSDSGRTEVRGVVGMFLPCVHALEGAGHECVWLLDLFFLFF